MARFLFVFLVTFLIFFFGIKSYVALSGKEKWELTKLLAYSFGCVILTTLVLVGIVVLF